MRKLKMTYKHKATEVTKGEKIKSGKKYHSLMEMRYIAQATAMARDAEIVYSLGKEYGIHSPEFLNVAHLMAYSGLNALQAMDVYFDKMEHLHAGDRPIELTEAEEKDMVNLVGRLSDNPHISPKTTLEIMIKRIKLSRKE